MFNYFFILLFILSCSFLKAQEKKYNYLEKLRNGKLVKVKSNSSLTYYLQDSDTVEYLKGELLFIDVDSIYVAKEYESRTLYNSEIDYYRTKNYSYPIGETLAKKNILYVIEDKGYGVKISFATISALGLLSALIVAPLASIDKKSPENFNVNRYKIIALSSLIVSGISLTISLSIPGKRTLQIPKNI